MAWFQEWFGEEYLELYSYRDATEARRQVAFFASHFGRLRGPVLDVGIGDHGPMPLARADMRMLPFCSGSFAGLVNFFTSFGYFSDEEENLRVVHEMARVLKKNAVFLFDYLNVSRERVRGYDLDEITRMFTSCGLAIRDTFGDFTDAPYQCTSPRLILAGRKI